MTSKNKDLAIIGFKSIVFLALSCTFFVVFGIEHASLLSLTRTLAITLSTYVFSSIIMSRVYGFLEIGKLKSKPIIFNTTIGVLITDLVTYAQLMIMNTNPNNAQSNPRLMFDSLHLLVLVFLIHFLIISIGSYLGNSLYFRMFNPLKTIIIYSGNHSLTKVEKLLNRYKLQYSLKGAYHIDDPDIEAHLISSDYVVFLDTDAIKQEELIEFCYFNNINFTFNSSISEVVIRSGLDEVFDDLPVVSVNVHGLTMSQRIVKRLFDIVFSSIALIIASPLLLIFSLAIKLQDGGSILFKQRRYTIGGNSFLVLKFRTMKEDVENYSSTGEKDDRITKVGGILRKIRMDELPQLINILKGEMSIVGPRPEMVENVVNYEMELPEFRYRLKVKAGLTGLAQIEGKYNTSPKDKLIFDLIYIENYSIWNDLKLILKTVLVFHKSDSTEGFEEK